MTAPPRAGRFAAGPALPATPLEVLRFVHERVQTGEGAALATITDLTGSSTRPVGTLMGIAADGGFVGSFSGGCIEAAVVTEARAAISEGRPRTVRYGAGSPFIDIRLPCGGGVDLLFQPDPSAAMLARAVSLLERRRPLMLVQGPEGALTCKAAERTFRPGWDAGRFRCWYAPPLRIVVLGHGAESVSLVQLGLAYGAQVKLLSPQEQAVAIAARIGAEAAHLLTASATDEMISDPWTAIVFLFHDHDWEPRLLKQALALPSLLVGAMGSRATHASRLAELRALGVTEASCARIASPLGLIPSARDPATLALSALAQIVDRYRLAVA